MLFQTWREGTHAGTWLRLALRIFYVGRLCTITHRPQCQTCYSSHRKHVVRRRHKFRFRKAKMWHRGTRFQHQRMALSTVFAFRLHKYKGSSTYGTFVWMLGDLRCCSALVWSLYTDLLLAIAYIVSFKHKQRHLLQAIFGSSRNFNSETANWCADWSTGLCTAIGDCQTKHTHILLFPDELERISRNKGCTHHIRQRP